MAEIKSTMDLVMERTRNLTMSEDDRRDQAVAEFRAAVNRLVQKYLQGELGEGRFQNELGRLEKDCPESGVKTAAAEIAKRIEPAQDSGPLLKLLRDGCEKDVSGIEILLNQYKEKDDLFVTRVSDKIIAELKKSGISGSAVIPNTLSDKDFTMMRQQMLLEFRKDMESEIDRMG